MTLSSIGTLANEILVCLAVHSSAKIGFPIALAIRLRESFPQQSMGRLGKVVHSEISVRNSALKSNSSVHCLRMMGLLLMVWGPEHRTWCISSID